jgi:LPXTG-site transpeptidase (sortase) family protein
MLVRHTKRSRQHRRRALLFIALILLVPTAVAVLLLSPARIGRSGSQPLETTPPTVSTQKMHIGFPLRLKISIINVDAVIAYAGLTPDGAMEIKKDPTEVAWYDRGPRPGENGSAVIAGHYGFLNGKGSVFNDLHTLIKGDVISVVDDRNNTYSFIVRESRTYNPAADASGVFNSNDGKAHLNLITCEGTWNNAQATYSDRRVVFTERINE